MPPPDPYQRETAAVASCRGDLNFGGFVGLATDAGNIAPRPSRRYSGVAPSRQGGEVRDDKAQ